MHLYPPKTPVLKRLNTFPRQLVGVMVTLKNNKVSGAISFDSLRKEHLLLNHDFEVRDVIGSERKVLGRDESKRVVF